MLLPLLLLLIVVGVTLFAAALFPSSLTYASPVVVFDEYIEIHNGYMITYPFKSYNNNTGKGWKWNGKSLSD